MQMWEHLEVREEKLQRCWNIVQQTYVSCKRLGLEGTLLA